MRLIKGSQNFPPDARPVVALGNFDGVHLGHRAIIGRAIAEALGAGVASAAYTFDPHPAKVLSPAECPPLIQTIEQRLRAIEALGVDICAVEPFTREFASQGAHTFFASVIRGRLKAKAIVAGYDFTFGIHRGGSSETLEALGREAGMAVHIVPPQFLGETLISSTNIRRLIERGDVAEGARLLGRPHAIEGDVVPGAGRGHSLGARTANLATSNELIPRDGVYLTLTRIGGETDGAWLPSLSSIGSNPTFPGAGFAIETHVLGWEADLSGRSASVAFLERMRDQIAFASASELKRQIAKDIAETRKRHAHRPPNPPGST